MKEEGGGQEERQTEQRKEGSGECHQVWEKLREKVTQPLKLAKLGITEQPHLTQVSAHYSVFVALQSFCPCAVPDGKNTHIVSGCDYKEHTHTNTYSEICLSTYTVHMYIILHILIYTHVHPAIDVRR